MIMRQFAARRFCMKMRVASYKPLCFLTSYSTCLTNRMTAPVLILSHDCVTDGSTMIMNLHLYLGTSWPKPWVGIELPILIHICLHNRMPSQCRVMKKPSVLKRPASRFIPKRGLARMATRNPPCKRRRRSTLSIHQDGKRLIPLQARHSTICQTAILYNLCIGISKVHTHQQLGISHATIERCGLRFEQHIEKQVVHRQEAIKLGEGMHWADVECDEVTLSRRHVDADHVVWAQYLGLVQRSRPESLILVRLPDRTTGIRAPGPGPLRKRDWEPIFNRYIRGRNIILHTDSARAYEPSLKASGRPGWFTK